MSESEADLLEVLLEMLDDQGIFNLGKLMGIMSKGDRVYIDKLKLEIKQFKAETIQHIIDKRNLIRELKEQREQDSKS